MDASKIDASKIDAGDRALDGDEVRRLRQALDEQEQRGLRLLAGFDNLRRRSVREQDAARREGRRAALLPLLAVLDTLERALAVGSIDADFYEGMAATHRQFMTALREAGAEPVASVGQPFDPNVHEAVATAPSESVQPGTVVRELRRGWRLDDELLRPAQVVVAEAPKAPVAAKANDPWR